MGGCLVALSDGVIELMATPHYAISASISHAKYQIQKPTAVSEILA